MAIGTSALGGAKVEATMRLTHVDRTPLGDLAAAAASLVCTNPGLDLRCKLRVGDRSVDVCVGDFAGDVPTTECV